MSAALVAILKRDLKLALRAGGGAGIGAIFFLAVVAIVPFAVGPDLPLLKRIGAALLWIGALLASLLGLERIFSADQEDGSLDLLFLAPVPLSLVAAAKALAHWIATGLPLVVMAPVLGLMLGVDPQALAAVTLTLLAGTPAVTFIGLMAGALAVTLPRSGLLVAVLVLPLAIPLLIFGVAATDAAVNNEILFGAPFRLLGAVSLFLLVLGPVAAAAALRYARE